MSFSTKKPSSWPRQAAIVVSDSPNVHMLLRELLRSYSWTVIDSTPSVEKAVAAVRQGLAYMIVVDDTMNAPAVSRLRYLLTDPIAAATPTLAFLMDFHKTDAAPIQNMGRPTVVEKPLTPSKFVPGFVSLVKMWEAEPFVTLRKANYQILNGNDAVGLKILLKLKDIDRVQHIASQALALHLRRMGKLKEAESLILNTLKRQPKDLGTMLTLGDLYMHSAMPNLAHRLYKSARGIYSSSLAILPDLVQAALVKGDMDLAIEYLMEMYRKDYRTEETVSFLSRLLFSEGRIADAERILNNNKSAFKRVDQSWQVAESQSLADAS